ncbi:HNH endonuclease family protein [Glycomyces salinus]|uniref:HNH endonuclease family protein n=1 Tax=Glycomyces salinus TaxID=980294 RepID=UPI0018EBE402|nr:HNH endonuclease family protein [Glycomyces salinus]
MSVRSRLVALAAAGLLPFTAGCQALEDLADEDPTDGADAGSGSVVSDEFSEHMPFTVTVDAAELTAQIEALTVAEEAGDGYDRDLFPHWRDADGNGCDARDDVLVFEERTGELSADDCDGAMSGQWVSMFDGETVTESSDLDVDHLVPLKEAWVSGARDWPTAEREAFANSLDRPWHLLAVTASTNRSKSDQDPAEWMPPLEEVWCEYVWAWVQVKTEWDLTVDQAEADALSEYAAAC